MPADKLTAHREAIIEVEYQIRSSRPLIYIITYEEKRVMDSLEAICRGEKGKRNWTLLTWDISDGLDSSTPYDQLPDNADRLNQLAVLRWFSEAEPLEDDRSMILVLKDYHRFMAE